MIEAVVRVLISAALRVRYRIRVTGLEDVVRKGSGRILFLPNHPALIDPVMIATLLHREFRPRVLADKDQINHPGVRWLARRLRVIPIPDMSVYGKSAKPAVEAALAESIRALQAGDNFLLYPSGHIYRTRQEDLRGNTAVERILREVPDVRMVLLRTSGLWGSCFGWGSGHAPKLTGNLGRLAWGVISSGLFFLPKREVTVEVLEPGTFPRGADRNTQNQFMEQFYNEVSAPNTYVPYSVWEKGGTRVVPEPEERAAANGGPVQVSATTRDTILAHLRELTGKADPGEDERLAHDLGLDSLARAELQVWLAREFGVSDIEADALHTVRDLFRVAAGEAAGAGAAQLPGPSAAWTVPANDERASLPPGDTLPEVFLRQAELHPSRPVAADLMRGVRTYRDLLTGIFALRPAIAALPGERVAIMLPASVAADVTLFTVLFAGKTPVMVNWTVGEKNILHGLNLTGVKAVLTSRLLTAKLQSLGSDLASVADRFVYLEDIAARLGLVAKLRAAFAARFTPGRLRRVTVTDTAVVLFTSGSESLPKAVPLSHANLLANLRDVLQTIHIRQDDSMLGMLPPFHSFGLTITVLAPICAGLRVVHYPNPTEGPALARLAASWRPSMALGTPTFLGGIARAAKPGDLDSVRFAVTGAEKCSEQVYALLTEHCPKAKIIEGYGITECSPIVAANNDTAPQPFTIGRVMPSLTYAIVGEETQARVVSGETGMLLVRGPSVFAGYLGQEGDGPFVAFDHERWYRTGDLVMERPDGVLVFKGRRKRFVKIGGEMVSLPAVEEVVNAAFSPPQQDEPCLAIETAGDDSASELVLFTTLELERATVNDRIRAAGLSGLHNIRRIVRVQAIPVLGTGKIDYRALRSQLG